MIYYGMIRGLATPVSCSQISHFYFTLSFCSSLTDADAAHLRITTAEKSDFIEEVTTEISVYLGMLYHLIEVFKGHDDFADELSEYSLNDQP